MKIEKGKLYYDTISKRLVKSNGDGFESAWTNKIAVICKDDLGWQYVKKQLPHLRICDKMSHNAQKWDGDVLISLDGEGGYCSRRYYEDEGYHIITIDQFKEFYPEQDEVKEFDKFAELKEAHKNGAVIEYRHASLPNAKWLLNENPAWHPDYEYRIKPEEENSSGSVDSRIDPIDFIVSNKFDFLEGCVIALVSQYKENDGLEDLKAARYYLQKLIDRYEN